MKKTLKLSTIMPVYNGERHIKAAIDSVLKQTFRGFELIVVDDCSSDQTEKIIKSYQDNRIVHIKNKKNYGVEKSRNIALDKCQGEYIANMDSDDISIVTRFEEQLQVLENQPDVGVVFSTVETIDKHGKRANRWTDDANCLSENDIYVLLPKRNCLANPTMMARASVLKKYRYDTRSKNTEDYNLWLRMLSDGVKFCKLQKPLLLYRIHTQSITQSSNRKKYGPYRKNISAKFHHLLSKAKKISFNQFDKKVFHYLLIDYLNLSKEYLKGPLKKNLILLGRFGWFVYPKQLKAKILFIFSSYEMGGAERVHLEVLRSVKKYNTITLFINKSRNKHFFKEYSALTNIIDTSKISNNILGRWFMAGYIQKSIEQSNIKMIFGSRSGLFYDILQSMKKDSVKIIELFHAMDGNIEFYSIKESERIHTRIFIDSATKNSFCKLFDRYNLDTTLKKRCIVIENGVIIPSVLHKTKQKNTLKVLFVGRDAPVKRLHIIRNIAQKLEKVSFVFVGVSDNVKDSKNIHAVGKVQDPQPYYNEADILLITSRSEGFPMVIMEAMAKGVVVISTDVGGISKHIHNADSGFLVESGDEKSIEEQVIAIINYLDSNKKVLDIMSTKSYEYAKEHFNIKRFYRQYEKLFDESLKGKQNG